VAGNGERGDGPDGDPLKCKLARPHGVAAGRRGTLVIADSENHRIRMLREIFPPPPPEHFGTRPAPGTAPPTEKAKPQQEKLPEKQPLETPRVKSPGEKSFSPSRRTPLH
jgi:hypothetical protein